MRARTPHSSRSTRIVRSVLGIILTAALIVGVVSIAGRDSVALGATTPHLVVIVMENKEFTDVVGSPAAPYINETLIPASRVFTQFYGLDHPSLPNYLMLTSATTAGCLDDACPPGFHRGENLFNQLDSEVVSWKAYMGGMSSNCYKSNKGTYLARHNPPIYYANLATGSCTAHDVPLAQLDTDLSTGSLPSFSWIAPDKYDSMHSNQDLAPCQRSTALLSEVCQGDRWLKRTLPPLLALNEDTDPANDVTVVLTFDEGTTGQGGGGHVLTLVTGPNVSPGQDAAMFNHLGLLNAIEQWFGVRKLHPKVPPLS